MSERSKGRYHNLFVGIPLPEKFKGEFRDACNQAKRLVRSLEFGNLNNPHITVWRLDNRFGKSFSRLEDVVSLGSCLLFGYSLEVNGFGYFEDGKGKPHSLHLKVQNPDELGRFRGFLREEFPANGRWKLPFAPHFTGLYVPDERCAEEVLKQRKKLAQLMDGIDWTFQVDRVGIFGVDNTHYFRGKAKLLDTVSVSPPAYHPNTQLLYQTAIA